MHVLFAIFVTEVVPVILDPTLIVDPDLWKSISKKPVRQLPKKYVVDYMLGNSVNDNVIKEWASKNGAEIVELKKGSQWYRTALRRIFVYFRACGVYFYRFIPWDYFFNHF